MKGTFFSADFIVDESNNLRLMELNTDTACVTDTLDAYFDLTEFINLLQTNNITKIHCVYKNIHLNFIDWFENKISTDATFITTFDKTVEQNETIYPTAVADADDKFILRLAYDENALFDSTYAKIRTNLLNIFQENGDKDSVPEYYLSGSTGIINEMTSSLNNNSRFPDVVRKKVLDGSGLSIDFLKFDNLDVSSSNDVWNDYLNNQLDTSVDYIEKYHINSDWSSNNRVDSIRQFGIVYGSTIDYIKFGSYKIQSVLELPAALSGSSTDNLITIGKQHYFEYTTNFMRHNKLDGILSSERIQNIDNTFAELPTVKVNDDVKSFFISGAPDTDDVNIFHSWSHDGDSFPVGSEVTASIVEAMHSSSLDYFNIVEKTLPNGETIYCGINKVFLIYESSSNQMMFRRANQITASDHYLVDHSGSLTPISQSAYVVLDSSEYDLYRLDVETTDTYFVSASQPVIVHNAPCFIGGTMVHTENGKKKIEDIKVGDKVVTYNHDNDSAEWKDVVEIMKKENEYVVTYVFENGTKLTATPDHPLFVVGKGYSSYQPIQTKDDCGLDVEQILLGDEVLHIDGYGVTIEDIIEEDETQTVYNLKKVDGNHNFYAEDFLAHNRFVPPCCFAAGTQILLSNGDSKDIEDIVVGDEVMGWNGEILEASKVIDINHKHTVESHWEACKRLGDEPSLYTINDTGIEFTPEHPFLTKEGWKSLVPDLSQEPYKSEAPAKELKVGDSINVNGLWEQIKEIKVARSNPNEIVYNITVDKIHSYIANGIIVHNK